MRVAATVLLSDEQREQLHSNARARSLPARVVLRAKIILLAAEGKQDKQIGEELGLPRQTAARWRKRFLRLGVAGLLKDAPRPGRTPALTAEQKAEIVRCTTQEKPAGATHWSSRRMARHAGVSPASVQRIWRAHGLKPHRVRTFKLSNDPHFAEKLEDILGLYLNPPEHALVWSTDEKSQIQALDRTQPSLPLKKGRCGTMTHDYKRNGTSTLFAALNTLTGRVIRQHERRHRHQEWLKFLKLLDAESPANKQVHVIADNYSTHKHPRVQSWLKRHPRFHMHFTPTSASWLNMVERFFRDLTENRLRRGTFHNVEQLTAAIDEYITHHNQHPKPFIWTAKASDILEKVKRARAALNKVRSV